MKTKEKSSNQKKENDAKQLKKHDDVSLSDFSKKELDKIVLTELEEQNETDKLLGQVSLDALYDKAESQMKRRRK